MHITHTRIMFKISSNCATGNECSLVSSYDGHPYDIYTLHIQIISYTVTNRFWAVLFHFTFSGLQTFSWIVSKKTCWKHTSWGVKFQEYKAEQPAQPHAHLFTNIHLPFMSVSSIYFYLYHIYTCPILIFFNIYTTWQNFHRNVFWQEIRIFYIEDIFISCNTLSF